jgi:hypothetical protein
VVCFFTKRVVIKASNGKYLSTPPFYPQAGMHDDYQQTVIAHGLVVCFSLKGW